MRQEKSTAVAGRSHKYRPFFSRLGCAVAVIVAVSACSYGGGIENPFVRKAAWFSFLDGEDLKAACAPSSPQTLRLVFNGTYKDHIAIYEIEQRPTGDAVLSSRVLEPLDLRQVELTFDSLGAPFTGKLSETPLPSDTVETLVAAVTAERASHPIIGEVRLPSTGYYWVASGCLQGKPMFHAWVHPEADVDDLAFLEPLGLTGGNALPTPPDDWRYRPVHIDRNSQDDPDRRGAFTLRAGPDGIIRTLF